MQVAKFGMPSRHSNIMQSVKELKPITGCASRKTDPTNDYACFNVKQEGGDSGPRKEVPPGSRGKAKEAVPEEASRNSSASQP